MAVRFFHPRTAAIFSGELRMIFNRRVLLVTVVILWLVIVMMHKAPQEETDTEVSNLYRQIVRTLTKSTFYGHEDISKSMWYFTPRSKKITPLDFNFLLDGADVCKNTTPVLLLTVMSLHHNAAQRKAIRETYGRVAKGGQWPGRQVNGDVRMVFMLGVSNSSKMNALIEDESNIYGDIVLGNFTESYFNLTYKVLMGIKWTRSFCPGAKFIMKADEDTFVDLPRVTDVLQSISMTNKIYGHFHYDDRVERDGKSKVSMEAYPLSRYAPHVKGNMYVMPFKLAVDIMTLSQYLPYVNMEDAHVTGIVAKLLDVRHYDIPPDQYDAYHPPSLCDFALHKKVFSQQVNASFAYKLWEALENPSMCRS